MKTPFIEAIGGSFEKKQKKVSHALTATLYPHKVQDGLSPLPRIKNIIAVGSGKGGVGKSTIAFNLAETLARNGLKVGIIDADIYGPSLPTLTGVFQRLSLSDDKKFIPHKKFGLDFVSIGHLVDPETALAWRGPMACGAMLQLFQQTLWPNLDLLIVDLPPGTGDLILSLCQKIPLAGVVIVGHPHALAVADKNRAISLFQKMHVPVLLEADNMQQNMTGLSYSELVYQCTGSALPIHAFAPASAEAKVFQMWAEELVDALASQPVLAPVSFKVL